MQQIKQVGSSQASNYRSGSSVVSNYNSSRRQIMRKSSTTKKGKEYYNSNNPVANEMKIALKKEGLGNFIDLMA